MKTMFKTKLDKQTLQKINQDLMNGGTLDEVATKNNVSYANVGYYRKKLVKAGILNPLYRTTKRKKRASKKTSYSKNTFTPNLFTPIERTQPTVVKSTKYGTPFTLVINDTAIDVTGAKHVNVTPGRVYIKY